MARRVTKKSGGADPFAERRKRLQKRIASEDIDAFLIVNPADIRYLTGFSGEDSYLIAPLKGRFWILSDFRFEEELAPLARSLQVYIRPSGTRMVDALQTAAKDLDLQRIGFQAEAMSVATRQKIGKRLARRKLVPLDDIMGALRVIKDEAELKIIRKAVRIQQQALEATLPTIEAGQTESQICAVLEYEMKARGASGPSFETIVAAQANGSLPHARPGRTRTRAGQPLLIDWGARLDGYASDLTRTFSIGRWSPRMREIYEIVLDAQMAACDAIRPGVRASDVDAVARNIIDRAGYGDAFGHSLGHGVGLDVHESPRLAASSDEELRSGMVVTVEPGIYLPGVGGVRIEDDVLVTERGRRILSSLPKDIDWATL